MNARFQLLPRGSRVRRPQDLAQRLVRLLAALWIELRQQRTSQAVVTEAIALLGAGQHALLDQHFQRGEQGLAVQLRDLEAHGQRDRLGMDAEHLAQRARVGAEAAQPGGQHLRACRRQLPLSQ
ncbi:MAG TPA: hypothetical protein VFZ61_16645 [Polyangiales bacterium]